MAQDQNVDHFVLRVHIDVVPVNRYGDKLDEQEGNFSFRTTMNGDLPEVMAKLHKIIKER